jgi:leader peptidase (prepilin peptidase)/N-methyltransferase
MEIWANCVLGWWLLVLGWIDARHMRLPDVLTLPLLVCGLASTWLLDRDLIALHAAGAVVGFLAFRGLAMVYRLLRGREGLGGGDAKLLSAGGAWVGLDRLAPVILVAATAAMAWILVQWLHKRPVSLTSAVSFGPFLAAAIWLVHFQENLATLLAWTLQ